MRDASHLLDHGQTTKGKIMTQYTAAIYTLGYLPEDTNPPVFDTAEHAWQYLASEVDSSWDDFPEDDNGACIEAHTQITNIDQSQPGTVIAPTPGFGDYGSRDPGLVYRVQVWSPLTVGDLVARYTD